jgi:hypothetical protein
MNPPPLFWSSADAADTAAAAPSAAAAAAAADESVGVVLGAALVHNFQIISIDELTSPASVYEARAEPSLATLLLVRGVHQSTYRRRLKQALQ